MMTRFHCVHTDIIHEKLKPPTLEKTESKKPFSYFNTHLRSDTAHTTESKWKEKKKIATTAIPHGNVVFFFLKSLGSWNDESTAFIQSVKNTGLPREKERKKKLHIIMADPPKAAQPMYTITETTKVYATS